jgi:hypothetical protein
MWFHFMNRKAKIRLRGIGPQKRHTLAACLLLLPFVTFAQSAGHPALPALDSFSLLSSADLPNAPMPVGPQNAQAQQQKAPQSNEPSLGDLGFTPAQTQANAKLQARLNKRTHMLKVHQMLGIITLAPMAATVIVSSGAKPKHSQTVNGTVIEPSSAGVDLHAALGSTTAVLYGLTAYYAIAAPKIAGVKPRGAIRLHRDLVWIHAPGMVLTPILGGMALSQENQGEKPHGIAAAHSYVAWTTVAAYATSMVAVSWPIHWKFWEK